MTTAKKRTVKKLDQGRKGEITYKVTVGDVMKGVEQDP